MNDPNRYVPVQTLMDAIKSVPEYQIQWSSAMIYYDGKNGDIYFRSTL